MVVLGMEVVTISGAVVVSTELLMLVVSDVVMSLGELVMAMSGLVIMMVMMESSGMGVTSFNGLAVLSAVMS